MSKTARLPLGFTLVELLIVISIIAILSTVGISAYAGSQRSARDAKRKADLNQINLYLQYYYSDNGKYPQAGGIPYGNAGSVQSTSGDAWIPALVSGGYTSRVPVDPLNNNSYPEVTGNYSYAYGNVTLDGQRYDLTTQLENGGDQDRCGVKNWKYCIGGIPGCPAAGQPWCTAFGGRYSNQIYEASPDR